MKVRPVMKQNLNCVKCELGNYCRETSAAVCIPGSGNKSAKLMIIVEAPDRDDGKAGAVMLSAYSSLLYRVIEDGLGLKKEDVYVTYLIKCKPSGNASIEQARACFEYLEEEILEVKPAVILTMGDLVNKHILNATGITRIRGTVYRKEIAGREIKIVPTFSIGYVMKVQAQLKTFAHDIEKAYEEANGIKKVKKESVSEIVTTIDQVNQVLDWVHETKTACFDVETYNLDISLKTNQITGISISFQPGSAYFIPLFHFETPFTEDECRQILELIRVRLLEDPTIRKIGQNIKFDFHILALYGLTKVRGRIDDTQLLSHLYDETTSNKLKDNVREYFPHEGDYENAIKQWKWAEIPLIPLAIYCNKDSDLTHRLSILFESYVLNDERSYIVYRNEIMAAFPVFKNAEWEGMLIDKDYLLSAIQETEEVKARQEQKLRNYSQVIGFENAMNEVKVAQKCKELQLRVNTLQETRMNRKVEKDRNRVTLTEQKYVDKIRELKSGSIKLYDAINFNSPPQLTSLLYTKEGFAFAPVFDARNQVYLMSTAKEVLMDLRDDSGFVDDLRLWRSFDKMLSTYMRGIYDRLDGNDKIHTSFLQHGTTTGRLSSRNPNLQNLPNISRLKNPDIIKAVESVKRSFIVPEGYTLIAVDYSQAELRIIAAFAEELVMLKSYADGLDLHAVTAAKMLGVEIDEFYHLDEKVQKEARTRAKAGNFGLIYGISAEGFVDYAKNTYGVILSLADSEKLKRLFFELYPRLLSYHALYIEKARQFKYVRTLTGRKRNLPDIFSHNSLLRSEAERAAINSPIQGTAGEFTILAAAILRHRLDPRIKFVLNVHDACYFYCPDELVKSAIPMIQNSCENLPLLQYFGKELKGVSMKVDVEVSKKNLKDTEPYDENNFN